MPSVRDLLPSCPFYSPFGPNKFIGEAVEWKGMTLTSVNTSY